MMPFIEIKGLPGKVFVPEAASNNQKKNKCPDCFSCQMCSDTRCQVCTNKLHVIKPHTCTCKNDHHEK